MQSASESKYGVHSVISVMDRTEAYTLFVLIDALFVIFRHVKEHTSTDIMEGTDKKCVNYYIKGFVCFFEEFRSQKRRYSPLYFNCNKTQYKPGSVCITAG